MPAQNIGIVYSANQQVIRRTVDTRIELDAKGNKITVDGDDRNLAHHQNAILSGETWATVPCAIYDTHTESLDTHAYLGLSGIPGVTDRHALVDQTNTVQAVVLVDPVIDAPPAPAAPTLAKGTMMMAAPVVQFTFIADPDGNYQTGDVVSEPIDSLTATPVVDGAAA